MKATVIASDLSILLLVVCGFSESLAGSTTDDDLCRAHTSCSACTLARYHHEKSSPPSPMKESDSESNAEKASHDAPTVTSWIHHKPKCAWNLTNASCAVASNITAAAVDDNNNITDTARFECECPYGPDPYPDDPPDMLPDWMGTLFANCSIFRSTTRIVDWSWPGTHDSLSYDLSLTVSDDGIDQMKWLADLFRNSHITLEHGELQDFVRVQAKTQQLTLTQQLDNGIRFLDLRLMYEAKQDEWYSLHCLQSNRPIAYYWQQLRDWLDEHPHELVLVWLSRHGNPSGSEDQYPNVPQAAKQAIWDTYTTILDGLLVNTTTFPHPLNETTIATLLDANMRVVTFATDYDAFTGASPLALDAASTLHNTWDSTGGMFDKAATLEAHCSYMANARETNRRVSADGGFTIRAMNTAVSKWPLIVAAQKRFLGWTPVAKHKCQIPDTTPAWCPESVLDMAQLASYYNQIVLQTATTTTAFPHAFYLDALDYNGTIRTGTQLLDGTQRGDDDIAPQRFAYVDTLLQYNMAQSQCSMTMVPPSMTARLAAYPAQFWDAPERGRTAIVPQCDELLGSIARIDRRIRSSHWETE